MVYTFKGRSYIPSTRFHSNNTLITVGPGFSLLNDNVLIYSKTFADTILKKKTSNIKDLSLKKEDLSLIEPSIVLYYLARRVVANPPSVNFATFP